MTMTTAERGLRISNGRLKSEISRLKAAGDRSFSVDNSFSNLVSSIVNPAMSQSNLTSINPMVENAVYYPVTLLRPLLSFMYKTHGIIQSAIDMPVNDAFRGGIDLKSGELSADELKRMSDEIEERGLLNVVAEAMIWARLFGGGALIVNSDSSPEKPLNQRTLRKFELYAANRWELQIPQEKINPAFSVADMGAPKNMQTYMFWSNSVDKSRVLTITGKTAPDIIKFQLQGWGMSEIERMLEDFNLYTRTRNVTYELLEEAKTDVVKLQGLAAATASSGGESLMRQRIEAMIRMKNFNNVLALDKGDEYDTKQVTFAGLAEVMKQNMVGIASATRIPMTKLFGISAAGFSSGEDDIENYNAIVESEVREKAKPIIRKVLRLLCVELFGEEYDISFTFKPLRVMGSEEEERVKTSKQTRVVSLKQSGLLTTKEAADALQTDGLISSDTAASKGLMEESDEESPMLPGFDDKQ